METGIQWAKMARKPGVYIRFLHPGIRNLFTPPGSFGPLPSSPLSERKLTFEHDPVDIPYIAATEYRRILWTFANMRYLLFPLALQERGGPDFGAGVRSKRRKQGDSPSLTQNDKLLQNKLFCSPFSGRGKGEGDRGH